MQKTIHCYPRQFICGQEVVTLPSPLPLNHHLVASKPLSPGRCSRAAPPPVATHPWSTCATWLLFTSLLPRSPSQCPASRGWRERERERGGGRERVRASAQEEHALACVCDCFARAPVPQPPHVDRAPPLFWVCVCCGRSPRQRGSATSRAAPRPWRGRTSSSASLRPTPRLPWRRPRMPGPPLALPRRG